MNKDALDEIMEDFTMHKFDILLCTTIIENGIDIANANTLIVYDADKFGLAQLYQIRGRVGRSDKIAYAYLLYNKKSIYLTSIQESVISHKMAFAAEKSRLKHGRVIKL